MATPHDGAHKSGILSKIRLFTPILAGATLKERLIGCFGALLGICVTGLVCGMAMGNGPHLPLIVAGSVALVVAAFAVGKKGLKQAGQLAKDVGARTRKKLLLPITIAGTTLWRLLERLRHAH